MVTVRSVQSDGSLLLTDGRRISPEFRKFTHGYCVTIHASQGRTVDHVYVAVDSHTLAMFHRHQVDGNDAPISSSSDSPPGTLTLRRGVAMTGEECEFLLRRWRDDKLGKVRRERTVWTASMTVSRPAPKSMSTLASTATSGRDRAGHRRA